jgi:hypothetical protein
MAMKSMLTRLMSWIVFVYVAINRPFVTHLLSVVLLKIAAVTLS